MNMDEDVGIGNMALHFLNSFPHLRVFEVSEFEARFTVNMDYSLLIAHTTDFVFLLHCNTHFIFRYQGFGYLFFFMNKKKKKKIEKDELFILNQDDLQFALTAENCEL